MNPLMGEATVDLPDLKLELVMNNGAWVQVEQVLDMSYLDALASLVEAEIMGRAPKLGVTRAILWGATRANHPEITLDECGQLVMEHGEGVLAPLGRAVRGSIKLKDPDQGEAKPPKPPAAKRKAAGNGTKR